MRKLLLALAPAIVTLGLVLPASPASAHNADPYSYWYCGASRPYTDMTIYHSEPTALWAGHVQYYCYGRNAAGGHEFQWWVNVNVDTGNWAMGSGFQDCDVIFCREP